MLERKPNVPNFVVAGSIKAGTSTLHHYLKQHPQVFVPERKELRYFAYDETDQWCAKNGHAFPIKSLDKYMEEFSTAAGQKAIGEVSPNYLASALAPQKIYSVFPDMKLIFSLRNPIDSAYSAYQMDVRAGREKRPIEIALRSTERRVERYRYFKYLKEWFALFKSQQILVVAFDNLISEPGKTMSEIYSFIGADPSFTPSLENVATNRGGLPETAIARRIYLTTLSFRKMKFARKARAYTPKFAHTFYRYLRDSSLKKAPPLSEGLRNDLCNYYKDDVKALASLTKLKIDDWRIL